MTEGQRYQIQALYCKGFSQREIANDIKVHHSTVSRELKRNRITGKSYCASAATTLANHRRRTAKKHARYHERHRQNIATGLLMGWSPEKIGLRMKLEAPELSLSHSTFISG
ncbi:MAG: helix-turn-helix domain-containing protein [Candidatus Symbiodolus clandestinus]